MSSTDIIFKKNYEWNQSVSGLPEVIGHPELLDLWSLSRHNHEAANPGNVKGAEHADEAFTGVT